MIQLKHCIIIIAVMIVSSSCEKEESFLDVNPSSLSFSVYGGTDTIQIKSNSKWNISDIPEWITVSDVSFMGSKQISVTARKNETGLSRHDSLLIRTGDNSCVEVIRFFQSVSETADDYLFEVVGQEEIVFNGTALSVDSIVIESDILWTLEGPEWIKASWNGKNIKLNSSSEVGGSGKLFLFTDQNNNKDDRSGIISIISSIDKKKIEVHVTQLGTLNVKLSELVVLSNGFAFSFKYGAKVTDIYWKLFEGSADPNMKTTESALSHYHSFKVGNYSIGHVSDCNPLSLFEVCTMGTNHNNEFGEVSSEFITTKSDVNAPWVDIVSISFDENGWNYSFSKNETTYGYYVYYSRSQNLSDYADSYVAWLFMKNMKKHPELFPIKHQDLRYSYNTQDDLRIVTWGVDLLDNLSGRINQHVCRTSELSTYRNSVRTVDYGVNTYNPNEEILFMSNQ